MPTPHEQRPLNDAFHSGDEGQDSSESIPLMQDLSTQALPNGRIGISTINFGQLPLAPPTTSTSTTTPIRPPTPRVSFWQNAVGALLPQHYVRVPTNAPGRRVIGGGTENDGVFANVSAKPSQSLRVADQDGNVHLVPEEIQKETLPSYAEAQADAVPSYRETTMHAPTAVPDPNASIIVDGLPAGPVLTFVCTAFVSFLFQFPGFLFTYVCHKTHAAKHGSRAGLGMTLIKYGASVERWQMSGDEGEGEAAAAASTAEVVANRNATRLSSALYCEMESAIASSNWIALVLTALGWFLLLSSCVGFYRVKRRESAIRAASLPAAPLMPERNERMTEEEMRLIRALQAADLL